MINFNSLLSRQLISVGWTGPPLVCPLLVLLAGGISGDVFSLSII